MRWFRIILTRLGGESCSDSCHFVDLAHILNWQSLVEVVIKVNQFHSRVSLERDQLLLHIAVLLRQLLIEVDMSNETLLSDESFKLLCLPLGTVNQDNVEWLGLP